ncbi:MAG: efflux RND transporter periplasmic adaptor subunit, partial [Polyangiaceae bacterium]|nr:efflux RND transporter periplasmic adaptor subunit [Polyangiaceae bacterium]
VDASTRGADPITEHGTLSLIENSVNATTGTIELKALFPNDDERLWPGQFVDVILRLEIQHDMLVVPAAAVQRGQDGMFVYVVDGDNQVALRPVKILRTVNNESVVESGLEPNETVVTDGHMSLVSGARVAVKTVGGDSSAENGAVPSPSSSAAPMGSVVP